MENFRVSLSTGGLASLPPGKYENDFTFIVGNTHITCPSFIAEFLSPKLSRVQQSDPTLSSYIMEISDSVRFEQFMKLGLGLDLCFDQSNLVTFLEIALELENEELYGKLIHSLGEELTIANVCPRFLAKRTHHMNCDAELTFLASHLYEFSELIFQQFETETAAAILSLPCLQIESEDWLVSALLKAVDFADTDSKCSLFEFVCFELVSPAVIAKFNSVISNHIEFLNGAIWDRLFRRLQCEIVCPPNIDTAANRFTKIFRYNCTGSGFDGIFHNLCQKHKSNVHDLGIVDITMSSCYGSDLSYAGKNVIDFHNDMYCCTTGEQNQWICFNFKRKKVFATHYSIQTRNNCGVNSHNSKSWVIEVSDDGSQWTVVDTHVNNPVLNGASITKTFQITNPRLASQIRMRLTGPVFNGNHYLTFVAFELFGTLVGF
jgi:hypothetical protein